MNIKNNILDILSPLDIYDPESLTQEASIYSSPLQKIDNQIDKLLNEIFIQTAKGPGLNKKIDLFSLNHNKTSQLEERDRLLFALATKPENFNKSGIIDSLKSLGFDCEIEENPKEETLKISFKDKSFKPKDPGLFKDLVLKMLPAHLDIIFDIDLEPTWADLENMSIDPSQELSWTNMF